MDGLVDPPPVVDEPVVDAAERGDAPARRCRSPRATSRLAACSWVSPASTCPFGIDPLAAARAGPAARSARRRGRSPRCARPVRRPRSRPAPEGEQGVGTASIVRASGTPPYRLPVPCPFVSLSRGPGDPDALTAAQRRAVGELLRLSPVIDALGERFAAAGHSLALVGGPVRDALLGRLRDDLDFTTVGPPRAGPRAGRRLGRRGLGRRHRVRHGRRCRKDGHRLEITTYRSEAYDPDSRKPDGRATATSLDGDLLRRDFTVNAMAVRAARHASSSTRTAGSPTSRPGVLRTPGRAARSPSPTTRCG